MDVDLLKKDVCKKIKPLSREIKDLQGHVRWLDGRRLYVSRIPHIDDRANNLYIGVSVWLSVSYLIHV